MNPKDYLRQMVDHTINGDPAEAEKAFKQYLVPKTMEILGLNTVVADAAPDNTVDTVVDKVADKDASGDT